jgi:pimeloyl-ACP methyl ester carboxylesterase
MSAYEHQSFQLNNTDNTIIFGDIRQPSQAGRYPLVLILHGFKSWKDWGFFPYVAEQIAETGAIGVNISFSHCGVTPGSDIIDKVEEFSNETITHQIQDVMHVISSIKSNKIDGIDLTEKWDGRIFIIGHSRGGAIAILVASRIEGINGLALWAPIARFIRVSSRQRQLWINEGRFTFHDAQSGIELYIKRNYIDDIEKNNHFDLIKAASLLTTPVIFLHGKQDLTVNIKESEMLFDAIQNKNKKIEIIERTGHTFGINHPFISPGDVLNSIISKTATFFKIR